MRSTCNLLLFGAVFAMAIAVPALAQPATDYPPPCDPSRVTRADSDRAHTVFLSGKQYLEESNYDKAISYFKDAYSIDCSVHAMLPIIATAYERKGDKSEAVRALEEYVRRASNAPDHDVIERRIKNLKDQLARDQPVAASAAPVVPATAQPVASPPTAILTEESLAAIASTPPASTAPATSSLPTTEGHRALPWIVVGVGGAAAVTGVVLYAAGASAVSTSLKECSTVLSDGRHICKTPDARDQGNRGTSMENVGEWLIGGGLAVAAAGLVWHFLERPADNTGAAPATRARVTPVVSPGYTGVTLSSTF